MTDKKKWIDTPGLKDVLKKEVPLASELLADRRYPILIRGTPRTGKSHVRDRIQEKLEKNGLKKKGVINCAAIPDKLVESELFGYKKGAFTDAKIDKPGLLSGSSGDPEIVFLEEIGELSKELQAKLLVFFDTGCFLPIGAKLGKEEKSTLRIIATSNAKKDKFRPDFLARFWEITIPPIHERREDIPFFLTHFLKGDEKKLSADELFYLMSYNWPGGVTEIEKVCIRITHHCLTQKIQQRYGYVRELISKNSIFESWYPYAAICNHLVGNDNGYTILKLFPHFYLGRLNGKPAPSFNNHDLIKEFEAWCYFFGQDPNMPLNINENFMESISKPASRELLFNWEDMGHDIDKRFFRNTQIEYFIDFLESQNLWNEEGRTFLNNLRQQVFALLDVFYNLGVEEENQEESQELPSFDQTSPNQYREHFFEQTSPKQYREQFGEFLRERGLKAKEIVEKYEVSKSTANRYLKDPEENK